MSGADGDVPLLWDTSEAASAFDPEDWIALCERETGRARPTLPPDAVQTVSEPQFAAALARFGAATDDFTQAGHPFAVIEHKGRPVTVGLSAKGSYAAGGLDEMIALGARRIVTLGGCGALVPGVAVGETVAATRALRDEGVSHHYVPPGRWVAADPALTEALVATHRGPVWTTTAHFRQSRPRLEAFRAEGCIAVNNESAGAFAVGRARGVRVAALLIVGDSLASGRFDASGDAPGDAHLARQFDTALAALTAVT